MAYSSKRGVLFWVLVALAFVGHHHNVCAEKNETSGMSKIANGRVATHRPYQVQLFNNLRFHCSGSILDNRWILTAAHCLLGINSQALHIVAGSKQLADISGPENLFRVVVAVMHQGYNRVTHKHDIALLKVDKPITFSRNQVWPIALNSNPVPVGQMLRVAGWGKTERYQLAKHAKETTVKVVSLQNCDDLWNTQLCAAPTYEGGVDCQGDSGGPVTDVYQKNVVGIVSYGYDDQCPSLRPSVYTNVAPYVKWISFIMNYYRSY